MAKIKSLIERVKVETDSDKCSAIYDEVSELKSRMNISKNTEHQAEHNTKNYEKEFAQSLEIKNNTEGLAKVLDQLTREPNMSHVDDNDSYSSSYVFDELENTVESLKSSSKSLKSTESISTKWCDLVILSMKQPDKWFAQILDNCVDDHTDNWSIVQPKMKEDYLNAVIKLIDTHPENDWYYSNSMSSIASWSWSKLIKSIKADTAHKRCWDLMKTFYELIMKKELVSDADQWTIFGLFLFHIIISFFREKIINEKVKEEYFQMYVPFIQDWHNKNEDDLTKMENESYKQYCDEMIAYLVANNLGSITGSEIDKQCQFYFASPDYTKITTITSAFKNGDDKTQQTVSKYVSDFVKRFEKAEYSELSSVVELLKLIYKKNPNLIENDIDVIEKAIDKDEYSSISICQLLTYCVPLKPDLFKNRGNDYCQKVRKLNSEYFGSTNMCLMIMQQIGLLSETDADRVVNIIDAEIKSSGQNQYVFPAAMSYEYQIAQKYPKIFQKRVPLLREYKKNATVASTAQGIIDLVEGRSLEKVSNDVDHQDKEIKAIGKDVNQTKDNVSKLDTKVVQQDETIKANTQKIQETKQGLNALGERVDVAEENIEKIDAKTVSNAPAWAKEVSKIMNPKTNNDWTLVAQRLNYSSSDIRGWATQPDTTMSMLAEFYTTNKTADATKYLIKILTDVNRLDAVNVIKKYEKNVENVVDDDKIYKAPPVVFISYQWGVQKNIKLLKDYIEKEGYSCWLDLGQMGGGDMLYEKINDGIRSAKIVITCMTELYTKSANCIREVNLANGLDKPIVPILLEKELSWPPPGSMGPILAGKLFIRFFQRDNEKTNDERFWPVDKYEELMDKIRGACGAPNQNVDNDVPVPLEATHNSAPSKERVAFQVCIL